MGRTRILTRPSGGWPRETVAFARRQIQFALGRFAGRVRSLNIRLTDLNGPKGGVDKQCVITVRLARRPDEIVVRDQDASAPVAIGRAAERVSRAVARAVRASGVGARRSTLARRQGAAVLLLCAAAVMPASAQVQPRAPVQPVASVDLARYVGDWFEVGRFPNRFQRTCVGDVTASYARRTDGRLDVINRCRTNDGPITARGVARVLDDTGARLKVRFAPAALSFLPFVWGDYWILGLAGDYTWAVVGSPDRDYLWILSRTPTLEAEPFAKALAAARANGFDVDRLEKTTHGVAPGRDDVTRR